MILIDVLFLLLFFSLNPQIPRGIKPKFLVPPNLLPFFTNDATVIRTQLLMTSLTITIAQLIEIEECLLTRSFYSLVSKTRIL